MKTSTVLAVGNVYSRVELADRFKITDATLNTGIFQPPGHESVWLFVTEKKTPDRTQYRDYLNGNDLSWDGQTSGRGDVGLVRISDEGRKMLPQKPDRITCGLLRKYPAYLDFAGKAAPATDRDGSSAAGLELDEHQTPLELLDASYQVLRKATAEELLSRLKACSSGFFEQVVVRLLLAMGYGGVAGEGLVTGKSGDAGIDGVIKEDKLGLDVVCIQAKRWDNPVGRPIVQGFVGSMDYIRARKGVILTTSQFTREATDFVDRIEGKKVVLIDGERLAELMMDHGVGVTTTKVYELREVSNDFFDEDEG